MSDELDVVRSIEALAADYAHGVDTRDYEGVAELFTADGALRARRTSDQSDDLLWRLDGRDDIVARLRGLDRFDRTFHQLAQHTIAVDRERATGLAYCVAHHLSRSGDDSSLYVMYIRYEDTYVIEDGRWRFADRLLWIDLEETRTGTVGST